MDIQYRISVLGWRVNTVTVLCVGQSALQLCCGMYSQYNEFVVGWTVIIVMLLCA